MIIQVVAVMKHLKLLKNNKGSFTIEACYTFLFTLLAVMFLIFIGSVYYQRAYIQSLADRAVKKAALVCNNPGADFETGYIHKDIMEEYSIVDLYTNSIITEEIQTKGQEFIKENIKTTRNLTVSQLLNTSSPEVSFEVSNNFIFKTISADIKVKNKLPIKFFGLENEFYIEAKSVTSVNNPKTFIDNVDFIIELIERIKPIDKNKKSK